MTEPSPKPVEGKTSGRCPICTKPTSKEHRPFCGKRCAVIDLGRWLNGSYAVPGEPTGNIDDGRFDEELG